MENLSDEKVKVSSNRYKHIIISLGFLIFIVFLVVDSILKPCIVTEKESDRVQRLYCSDILEAFDNGTIVPGQNFLCDSDGGAPNKKSDWRINPNKEGSCIQSSSCTKSALTQFVNWIAENTALGFFVTVIVYILATILIIPGSILTLGAGAAFGAALGLGVGLVVATASVWLGASIGAMIAFLNGKYLLRDLVNQYLISKYKVFKVIDLALLENGLKVVLLLRLSPVVPFNVFNYIMGATACSFRDYSLGTIFGIIPGSIAYVFVGASVAAALGSGKKSGSGTDLDDTVVISGCENDTKRIVDTVIFIIGGVATFLAVLLLSKYARSQWVILTKKLENTEVLNERQETEENKVKPSI